MQKIVPHLWFDKEADEAASFYTSIFEDSAIHERTTLDDTPSGTAVTVALELMGQRFIFLSAGPLFKFTPAVSFIAMCESAAEAERLWSALSEGGSALMPFESYPFAEKFGWVEDRYSLSWQIMYPGGAGQTRRIIPSLLFTKGRAGKTEEAIRFYTSVFRDAGIGDINRYGPGQEPDREGTVSQASFTIEGQEFSAMDSARSHDFTFSEAVSFMVYCKDQAEIDYYWTKLSAVPESEQCGWLKDKFGLSWQIVPAILDEMMRDKDRTRAARVTEAFLAMKKLDIAKLLEAYG